MTAQPIELRLTIGDQVYTYSGVADPEDAMFAVKLGNAIAEVVIEHGERDRPSIGDMIAATVDEMNQRAAAEQRKPLNQRFIAHWGADPERAELIGPRPHEHDWYYAPAYVTGELHSVYRCSTCGMERSE